MVIGIDKNIPTVPNKKPQKSKDRKTTKVESPCFLPITLGSITLPTTTFTRTKAIVVQTTPENSSCTIENRTAGITAMKDPILGI